MEKYEDPHYLRCFGGPGVVHGVVLQVLRHVLTPVQALLDLSVGDVSGHHQGARQVQPRSDWVLGKCG